MITTPFSISTTPSPSSSPLSFSSPRLLFSTTPRFLSPPKPPFQNNNNNNRSSLLFTSSRSNNNNPTPEETECPVPLEQQPINEYQSLSTSFPFSWASGDVVEYGSRLFVTGAAFAILVGMPVAWYGAVGAETEPVKRIVCGASSGVLVVTVAVVRMYLGWAYVGNRLLSATVEYEETGWYDGQIWVKTAEVLARDRLLGSFSVKPVLSRLKTTLIGLAISLLVFALVLVNIDGVEDYLNLKSKDSGTQVVRGVYNDESARSFEPDAFCGEPNLE